MSIFNQISVRKPRYNNFSLSHDKKLTFQIGALIPTLCTEVIPGDMFDIRSSQMVRFMPLVSPVMHRFDVYMHYFFVPNRLLWENWEDFITGGVDGEDTSVMPYCELDSVGIGTTGDYLGLPFFGSGTNDLRVSALPDAAIRKIFSDYYRDENLNTAQEFDILPDGIIASHRYSSVPYNRAWTKDYFTSALPWTQRGPEATIPLGTSADLNVTGTGLSFDNTMAVTTAMKTSGADFGPGPDDVNWVRNGSFNDIANLRIEGANLALNVSENNYIDPTKVTVDLSSATAATINDLRQAFRLQEFLEKNARGGSRYIEIILSHFGVRSSDARLQRAEFLGGSKTPVQISEVLQTGESGTTPQGNMAGHGISVGGGKRISYRAEEHGFIVCLMSVMPKPSYMQGVHKSFTRFDKLDYYWPSFANLGEQPILNQELYFSNSDANNEDVFGYTPRYAEYKFLPSTVHGQFKTTLDFWHAARIFSARPGLNNTFIQCQSSEVDRIFAVTDPAEHKMWAQVYHDIRAKRPMPYFGTPTI